METADTYQDRRRALASRPMQPPSDGGGGGLFAFDVVARTADGRRRRVNVLKPSRFIAARFAGQIITQDDFEPLAVGNITELPAGPAAVESVSLRFDTAALLAYAPDESQGVVDHYITVQSGDDRKVVHAAADNRRRAVDDALSRFPPGASVVAVTVRWVVLGNCLSCDVHVFADCRHRFERAGVKCLDCP